MSTEKNEKDNRMGTKVEKRDFVSGKSVKMNGDNKSGKQIDQIHFGELKEFGVKGGEDQGGEGEKKYKKKMHAVSIYSRNEGFGNNQKDN